MKPPIVPTIFIVLNTFGILNIKTVNNDNNGFDLPF